MQEATSILKSQFDVQSHIPLLPYEVLQQTEFQISQLST